MPLDKVRAERLRRRRRGLPEKRIINKPEWRHALDVEGVEDIQSPHGERQLLWRHLPQGAWKGGRAFLVGGGPSLKNFDWDFLKYELSIGINRAFEYYDPTILFSMDYRLWGWIESNKLGDRSREAFLRSTAMKTWLRTSDYDLAPEIYYLKCHPNPNGMSPSIVEGLGHGQNSGFAALNLAICLGANPIYLLGYDMHGEGDSQVWFHDGYPSVQGSRVYENFRGFFDKAAPWIKERTRVINLSEESALECFEKGKLADVPQVRRPVFVSFYTEGTPYEDEVPKLQGTLRKFSLEHSIKGIPNEGSWDLNTYKKAEFLRTSLDEHGGRDVVWVDVDSRVCRYPALFQDYPHDLGVHSIDWSQYKRRAGCTEQELDSAVMYLKNTASVRSLLDRWVRRNREEGAKPKPQWEQKNLQEVLVHPDGVDVHNIPATYCQIFDLMVEAGEPVIEQTQVSRRFKSLIAPVRGQGTPIREQTQASLACCKQQRVSTAEYDFSIGVTRELIDTLGEEAVRWSMLGYNGEEIFRKLLADAKPTIALEIGTFQGVSSSIMAQHAEMVVTFDILLQPARNSVWEVFKVRDRIAAFIIDSDDALDGAIKHLGLRPDLVFVDGNHSYESVSANFKTAHDTGAKTIIFHDYRPGSNHDHRTVRFVDAIQEGSVEKVPPFACWRA